jgi:dinuclear metal center YbgI/SA1388 family protein
MTTIRDIARVLEAWAPPGLAQSYDNVGLQVGDPAQEVAAVVVALDLTPAVMEEARAVGATLVLTHHPLLFRPLKSLTPSHWAGGLALRLAQAGIALYSLHTNLDAAPGGVSFALAEHLGLEGVRFLEPMDNLLVKLATFVPLTHLEAVRTALAAAGAGQIGHYDACAFASTGTGYFRATAAANPFVGTPGGGVERVDEARLEVQVARWHLPAVVAALRASHPYEEVAYDVYPVQQPAPQAGLGAIGHLPVPESLPAFLHRVVERLETGSLRYVGDPTTTVRTVAVCGGAGRGRRLRHCRRDLPQVLRRAGPGRPPPHGLHRRRALRNRSPHRSPAHRPPARAFPRPALAPDAHPHQSHPNLCAEPLILRTKCGELSPAPRV